jgi:hypothetical protein
MNSRANPPADGKKNRLEINMIPIFHVRLASKRKKIKNSLDSRLWPLAVTGVSAAAVDLL